MMILCDDNLNEFLELKKVNVETYLIKLSRYFEKLEND